MFTLNYNIMNCLKLLLPMYLNSTTANKLQKQTGYQIVKHITQIW